KKPVLPLMQGKQAIKYFYSDTGTIVPSYSSSINSCISSECSTSTNVCNASFSSSSLFTATTLTYGELSSSINIESSSGINPASMAYFVLITTNTSSSDS